MTRRIALALTGASGMPYGIRLLECLLAAGVLAAIAAGISLLRAGRLASH